MQIAHRTITQMGVRGLLLVGLLLPACSPETSSDAKAGNAVLGNTKSDTGWVADTSFEISAKLTGQVLVADPEDVGTVADQQQLISKQIRFAKNALADRGYIFNQLYEAIDTMAVTTVNTAQGPQTVLDYTAAVDLLGKKKRSAAVPRLDELDETSFEVALPHDPTKVYKRTERTCTVNTKKGISEANLYYYFDAEAQDCELPLYDAKVVFTAINPVHEVYPEYDRLLRPLDGSGLVGVRGFRVALVPARGDKEKLARFNAHKTMLEKSLLLTAEPTKAAETNNPVRYVWKNHSEKVAIVIDLYEPPSGDFEAYFRQKLNDDYQFIYYNGHSNYGGKNLVNIAGSYQSGYQIIGMHSCRSYAYYARQVFRAKATAADPQGFAHADVFSTGNPSYPSDSPDALQILLENLMLGIDAVDSGQRQLAPSWLSIVTAINKEISGIYYGMAGVQNNCWAPLTSYCQLPPE